MPPARLGSWKFPRLQPVKIVRTVLIITHARITIIRPTIAATIVPLAASTFPLSPPERIQRIPPQSKKRREATIPTTISPLITNRIRTLASAPFADPAALGASRLILSANAYGTKVKKVTTEEPIASVFFMTVFIRTCLKCVVNRSIKLPAAACNRALVTYPYSVVGGRTIVSY